MSSSKPDKNISEIKKQLAECQREKKEYLEGWQRARADLINYKKLESERLSRFIKQANRDILKDLLVVLDNLSRLEKEVEHKYGQDAFFDGVVKTRKGFLDVLDDWGVVRIKTEGQDFDPKRHEAVAEVDDSDLEEGKIVEEVLSGYLLNGEVLRPAQVKVAGAKKEIK
ncbi:MAG TPA: nucleotide exchange factor GrpE [Candidatus Pacearchaeota archaeon]|nr:nucleotide exchange factor GrpE [Candidatus Pacearchaeota archaeon]